MERLGLWGDGATFKSFEQFIDTVQRKGLGKDLILVSAQKVSDQKVSGHKVSDL